MSKELKPKKKKQQRHFPVGVVHVRATFNNTIVTVTDLTGHVVAWASAGTVNFSGARKSASFAATVAAQEVGKKVFDLGMKEVQVNLKGPGSGRESAVRGLQAAGLAITVIKDVTPLPHNGCRPKKRRRV